MSTVYGIFNATASLIMEINNERIENIIIFCPSKITGGHEYLSVRLAECLLEIQDKYKIYYCDYPDGFSHTRWHSEKIEYIDYVNEQIPVKIPPHSIVLAQLNLISQLCRFEMDCENSTIIFWLLHFLNIKSQIYCWGRYWLSKTERRQLGNEIRYLSELGVIKCMAYGAYASLIQDFYQKPQIFPWLPNIAPIKSNIQPPSFSRINANEIKFCWLGRLDQEKARNVLTYMNELEDVSKNFKLSLSLIGRGPAEEMIKKEAKNYSFPIVFVGEKRDSDLDFFIRNETEIGLASGTSAFEFSLRGKPVIMDWVIEKIYTAGVRDRYIFTDESEKYDYESGFELKRIGASYFVVKLKEILNNYETISKRGYDFIMGKSADNCSNCLLETIKFVEKQDFENISNHIEKVSNIVNKGHKRILFVSKILRLVKLLKNK